LKLKIVRQSLKLKFGIDQSISDQNEFEYKSYNPVTHAEYSFYNRGSAAINPAECN
jgi:hypothetical protein